MIEGRVALRKCPICGKVFYCDYEEIWVYKRIDHKHGSHIKMFCSWGCMRKWDAENRPKPKEVDIELDG